MQIIDFHRSCIIIYLGSCPPEERAFPDFNCHRVQDGQWRLLRKDWEQWFTGPNSLSSMAENSVWEFGGCLLLDMCSYFLRRERISKQMTYISYDILIICTNI